MRKMKLPYQIFCSCILFLVFNLLDNSTCSLQGDVIQRWANRLGKDLWVLGRAVTNKGFFENSYRRIDLETKDPKQIIEEIVGNVSLMMKKKMDAVRCIINEAELVAASFVLNETNENYTYYRSNPPGIYDSELTGYDLMNVPMTTNNDSHFFNLSVNTNYSSVHVPTNVYPKHEKPLSAIQWSESLDKVFITNYKADPALSWQYFGSATGIMRHYPAMTWGSNDKGLFDCRIRTWFIEAATCTKDVVILLDNSGSMTGMHKHIATFTVNTILDTLSNNDYVNIMNFSETVNYTVPCFKDKIVQATEENIVVLKDSLLTLEPQNKSFVDIAFREGFKLLHKYREKRSCNDSMGKFCNQAIMLIADAIPINISDVIDEYNRVENESSIPIRIFTFLVGKEATNHIDSVWMACSNRGFYSHVDALDQVTAAVYQYILVFARPLVLHAQHPLSWTHAYFDDTFEFENKSGRSKAMEKYRLLTSVAGPVLDLNAKSRDKITANLLGVAATDVPILEIAKLMYPYKTGVNSHSFIISNNGYVLKHPDLRPMFEDILKDNYNSIDLTEVEQLDDKLGPREIGEELLQLRSALVHGEEGIMHDIQIKYHYDDMRRVSREINDYYYAPIKETPFSIAFAIPDLYGNYSIQVKDEITAHRFSTQPISDFFSGTNWKIHPKWVYCKYHYLEGHEFETPESELVHFIEKMKSSDFKWSLQYEPKTERLNADDYYCDRNLVKHIVFDAKRTKPAFDSPWEPQNSAERNLKILYNPTLRFVATMSGLTRWEYIDSNYSKETHTFGELHHRAIDETWYKSAVIQHRHNDRSFVYSVPFDSQDDEDLMVTGSSAIFPERNNVSAPGEVVGFQFSHSLLQKQFFNITAVTCPGCLSCGEDLECYVVDSSGYIIVSRNKADTGVFFGEIDGNIMEAMIKQEIYEKVTIRDYQAICYYSAWVKGAGNILITPFNYLKWIAKWILSQFAWTIVKFNLNPLWETNSWLTTATDQATFTAIEKPKPTKSTCNKKCNKEEEKWHDKNKIPIYEKSYAACEKERDLYVLRQDLFRTRIYSETVPAPACVRPFYLKKIPYSNLLLIAIDTTNKPSTNCYYVHNTRIRDIVYENETYFPCQKLYLNELERAPLQGCYNEHPLEQEIKECGSSRPIFYIINLVIVSILLFMCK